MSKNLEFDQMHNEENSHNYADRLSPEDLVNLRTERTEMMNKQIKDVIRFYMGMEVKNLSVEFDLVPE